MQGEKNKNFNEFVNIDFETSNNQNVKSELKQVIIAHNTTKVDASSCSNTNIAMQNDKNYNLQDNFAPTSPKKSVLYKPLFILPSVFTSLNLICGYTSILFSSQNEFLLAGWFVVLAVLCDILDGRIARYSSLTSKFGAELDSLADLVSFGVAPAFLVFKRYFVENPLFGAACTVLFVLCGALRLARFNITPPSEKDVFIGLPIPAGAGILCTLTISEIQYYPYFKIPEHIIPIIIIATSLLMVSTIEYPAMKKTQKTSVQRRIIALASLFVFLFFPPLYLLVISWGFAFYGLTIFMIKKIFLLSARFKASLNKKKA